MKKLFLFLSLSISSLHGQIVNFKIENVVNVETFPANDVYYNRIGVWNFDSTAKARFYDPTSNKTINTPTHMWAHRYIDFQRKEIQEWAGVFCFTRYEICSTEKINDHVLKIVVGTEDIQKSVNKVPDVKVFYQELIIDFNLNKLTWNSIVLFQGNKWTCVLIEPNLGKLRINKVVSQ